MQARALTGRWLLHPAAKPVAWLLCLLPLAGLLTGVVGDQLGPNPAQALVRSTGDWALRFLCLALAVTPLRVLGGLPPLARFRRLIGLFAYTYLGLHLLCYAWFEIGRAHV